VAEAKVVVREARGIARALNPRPLLAEREILSERGNMRG
jgi:hypothetical protein